MAGETKSQRAGEATQAKIHKRAYGTGKDRGRPHARGNGTACGIPPEESRPAESKEGEKENRSARGKGQLV